MQPREFAAAADGVGVDWHAIRGEWRDREYATLRRAAAALDGVAVDRVDDLLFAPETPQGDQVTSVLRVAFAAASTTEDGPLLLALFVHGRCLEKWERTEDYTRIDDVLDALGVVVGAGLPAWRAPTSHAQMLDIIVRQARVVAVAMTVEDGMSCSCPVAVGDRARVVVDALGAVLAEEGALGDDLQDLREVVRTDATTTRRYFDTIARVADAVGTFVEQEVPGPVDDIDDVLVALGAPALFEGDVYESELRAHRAALIALRDSAREPRLNVDAAELVYLYPFALDGITGDEAVARARRGVIASTLATLGLESAGAEDLDVNDLWDVPDAREPGYGGASIELPPLRVKTTADEWLDDFDVEIRLSRLGNHHLRVRSRLANAGLHEVNQALRRGSHAMGKEQFDPAVLDCRTFREYADTIIRTVADAVQADAVRNLTSQFHVVVGARAISVRDATGGTPTATLTDLERAVGSTLLFHPVRHLATALEEWIRYPRSMMRNLLADEGFAGDLVARTDNTTITFMPSSPEWLVDEYEEMVEFVASIPPLLTLWEKEASRLANKLDRALVGRPSIDKLHDHERKILDLERHIRVQLSFLHSQSLCRTRGQRRFLDQLWTAAGMPALEDELERSLTLLSDRERRIAAMVASIDEHRRRKQGTRVEMVLVFLAAASVSGVVLWFKEAFDVGSRNWAWGEAAVQAAVALLVVAIVFLTRRSE